MFEPAATPQRPAPRRRRTGPQAESTARAPEAANEPRLVSPAPAVAPTAPTSPKASGAEAQESTLPRYLRGGAIAAPEGVALPGADQGPAPAGGPEAPNREGAPQEAEPRPEGEQVLADGQDRPRPARTDRRPGERGARAEGKASASRAEAAQTTPQAKAQARPAPAAAVATGTAPAAGAAAGAMAAGGGAAGGAGPAPAAPGAEAAAEGAQTETEERLDAAEPEDDATAGDAEAGGPAAEPAPAAASSHPTAGAPAEAPTAASEAESDAEAGTEAAAPEAAAPEPAPAATAADPSATPREQAAVEQREAQADAERVAQQTSESREEDQAEADAEGGSAAGAEPADVQLAGPEREAALGSLGEELPAEAGGAGGAGGGGGGGGAPAPAEQAPPDVAGLPPEQGLATLAQATPAQAEVALGGVAAAAAAESTAQAAEVQSTLPEATLGEPVPARPAAPQGGPAAASTPQETAAGPAPKAELQPTPEPPAGNAADRIARPEIPKPAEGAEPTEGQKAQLASAIAALPGTDPGLQMRLGSAPQLALSGAADPAQVAAQKAQSAQAVAQARATEAAEVAKPMGEQDVRPTVGVAQIQARTLKPAGAAGGGGGAAGGGGGAGAGAGGGDKARGILAEELKGPEVRAAMAAASAKAAAAKAEAQAKVAAGNTAAEARIGELKAQAAADQDAARAQVRADAAAARAEHAAQQEAAVAKLDKTQQDTLAETETQVAERKREGDEAAAGQIEEGDRQVADKQAEVETQVEGKKQEVAQASEEKGFFGRLADSVGAWFDRAKQWISEKVEAGKRWIKDTADRFKKYAAEKIDAARDAVTGLIQKAGAALIAASDVLLAEFPAARDAVRGTIQRGVDWGVAKTNQIAEGAKTAVNKAVDTAAAVAEAALDVGGKVVNAALDAAKATTVGALNAADKVAQALGVLKVLIEDVASNPGGWIANLGASARDGVANHLAAAMKAAIKQWWEGKLESVLGVGPAVWETLKKGGLGLKEIGAMAWSAIKAAIPPALIQLVIEKLVAMIIPAAGAVMAIIEGLQAAWGSVSAILGAVGKAIAFLKAVKGGGAGPQFAALVAAAAIVVIDFVSNWLLQRLGKAILKIAGKVKGIAQKLMKKISGAVKKALAKKKAKGRAKKAANKKRDKAARDRKARQLREQRKARGKGKDPAKKDDPGRRAQEKERRKAEAVEAARAEVQALVRRPMSRLALRLRLAMVLAKYRLRGVKQVSLRGDRILVRASPGPEVTLEPVELGRLLEPILVVAEREYLAQFQRAPEESEGESEGAGSSRSDNDVERMIRMREARGQGMAARGGNADARTAAQARKPGSMTPDTKATWGLWFLRWTLSTFRLWPKDAKSMPPDYARMRRELDDAKLRSLGPDDAAFVANLGVLERARKQGMLPAMDIAQALGEKGHATPSELLFGDLAPMATVGSSIDAHKTDVKQDLTEEALKKRAEQPGADGEKAREKLAERQQTAAAARTTRHERIGNIFVRLRAAVKAQTGTIVAGAGPDLGALSRAVDSWLRAKRGGEGADRGEIKRRAHALIGEIVAFLKAYRG